MKQGGGGESMPKYRFLHRQINTEWVVLADNSKDKKIKRTEDKLFYTFYLCINSFLSTAYCQVTSTDTCKSMLISIQVLKTSLHNFSTVNFRSKTNKKNRRGAAMRERCAWTTLHEEALLSVPTERTGRQASLKIWQNSLTQPCVLVFLQSYNIPSLLCTLSHSWKDTGNWDIRQAPCSPSLYSQTQTDSLQRQKGSFSPLPLPKKVCFRKKYHFQRSFFLTTAELCNSCCPVNPKSSSSFTGVTLYQHLELAWELR